MNLPASDYKSLQNAHPSTSMSWQFTCRLHRNRHIIWGRSVINY